MHTNQRPGGSRLKGAFFVAIVVAALAGCSATTPSAAVAGATSSAMASVAAEASQTAPPATDTPAPTSTETPAPPSTTGKLGGALDGPTGVPTVLDPCKLFTSAQASQLAGTQFGAGRESTTEGNGRICTYGSIAVSTVMVEVVQAPSVAVAQAAKAQAESEANAAVASFGSIGLQLTQLPNLADGAAMLAGSKTAYGRTLSARGIYVLKGAVFFALSDVAMGAGTPSADAMQAAAQTILSQLP